MRIVISHEGFDAFGGTETYMFTIAQQLEALGHDAVIYAQRLGPMADFALAHGLRVTANAAELPSACDGVLAQDAASALELAARYPETPRVFVAHSDYFPLQAPPQLEGVCNVVVVLNDRVGRFVEHLGFHAPTARLRQPIDLKRFRPLGLHLGRPRRAIVIGNYLRGARAQSVADACAKAGLEVSWVGAHTEPSASPEHAIASADMVLGLGRCILEGMACGRAAYVFGIAGGDGWVTQANYEALESDGFSGQLSGAPHDSETLARDLGDWAPDMGLANRELACAHHNASEHAVELVALLRRLGALDGEPPSNARELARLVRVEWQTYARLESALRDNRALRDRLDERELAAERAGGAEAAAVVAAAEAYRELEALRRTRRYRLACRIAAPLDVLRRRLGRS